MFAQYLHGPGGTLGGNPTSHTPLVGGLIKIGQKVAQDSRTKTNPNLGSNPVPTTNGFAALDRLTNSIQPGSHLKRTPDMAGFDHYKFGGYPPIPDVQIAPFKRAYMPNSANIPVNVHRLSHVKVGQSVTVPLFLASEPYGQSSKDLGAMKTLFSEGMPTWVNKNVSKVNDVVRVEAQTVSTLNRKAVMKAYQNENLPLLDFDDFSETWAPFGLVKYIESGEVDQSNDGTSSSVLAILMDGPMEIPNIWLDWPKRLQVGDTLYLIHVSRSLGYEEKEREFMLRRDPDGFVEYYRNEERRRISARPAHDAQLRMLDEVARRRAEANRALDVPAVATSSSNYASDRDCGAGMMLSGQYSDSQQMRESLVHAKRNPPRYARWETYVTSNGMPPPKFVYNIPSIVNGELQEGGYRAIGTVLRDHPAFDDRTRWTFEIKTALYANPTNMGEMAPQWSECMKCLPKVRIQAFSSHA